MEKAENNEPFGLPSASLEMARYAPVPEAQGAAAAEAQGAAR
jgi:hypothetical protein